MMAEGDALLVSAWDRVATSKKETKDKSTFADDNDDYSAYDQSVRGHGNKTMSSRQLVGGINSSTRHLFKPGSGDGDDDDDSGDELHLAALQQENAAPLQIVVS
jgi:hypothetical protein